MKTRNEIYQGEGAKLLRFITTYHTLRYDQVLQLFSRHEQSIKSLITSLIKQGRIIYDKREKGLQQRLHPFFFRSHAAVLPLCSISKTVYYVQSHAVY